MPFDQKRLDLSVEQTRGIFNKYIYRPDNNDSLADVQTPGYFNDSRFAGDPDWVGSLIECTLSDAYAIGQVSSDGALFILVDNANIRRVQQKTANYTLQQSDSGSIIVWNIASVPFLFLNDGFAVGTGFSVLNIGASGSVIVTPTGSETILGTDQVSDPTKQLALIKITSNTWQGAEI